MTMWKVESTKAEAAGFEIHADSDGYWRLDGKTQQGWRLELSGRVPTTESTVSAGFNIPTLEDVQKAAEAAADWAYDAVSGWQGRS